MVEMVGNMASFIGSLTVVGGALLWIYNSTIAKPREKRRKEEEDKRQGKMIALITQKNEPLNQSIQELNRLLGESQKDRAKLNDIAKANTEMLGEHDERLDNHNDRLIVLETKTGVKRITYRKEND